MRETDNISIHTKRYYLVILEGIDPNRETTESFAIKLSMRTRTTLPRVRQILRNLPYTIKRGLSMAQANRLKNVIEEIGGMVRLEHHFVTPGEGREQPKSPPTEEPARAADREIPSEARQAKDMPKPEMSSTGTLADEVSKAAITCPACGWEEEEDATYCSLCLRRFRDLKSRRPTLGHRIPEENPLKAQGTATEKAGIMDRVAWQDYKLLLIAGGVLLAVILFVFIK